MAIYATSGCIDSGRVVETGPSMGSPDLRRRAYRLILVLGFVSLFGDISYEGVRSVSGPYLALLGASATVIGLVSGLGEFAGYALRTGAGYLADRLRSYWLFTFAGYAAIVSLPLLALTHQWQLAALLITLERLGKALRTPARDAILSHAASEVGRGKGFGLHEMLDQIGALLGPLLFSLALTMDIVRGYQIGFGLLAGPTLIVLLLLLFAWRLEPIPELLERRSARSLAPQSEKGRLTGAFWCYAAFTVSTTLGFAPFPLLAYHLEKTSIFSVAALPLLYALAMGVDGLVALGAGWAFDRWGLATLVGVPLSVFLASLGAFHTSPVAIVLGIVAWGVAMGLVETNMRAAVGELTDRENRGFAYGVFNTLFGLAWLIGGFVLGLVYDGNGASGVVAVVAILQAMAFILFWIAGVSRAHQATRKGNAHVE